MKKILLFLFVIFFLFSFCSFHASNSLDVLEIHTDSITEVQTKDNSILGMLVIPKIHLKQNFFSYDSSNNTVEKGLEVITQNCFPFESCNFVLASHSGNSSISFFQHLDLLQLFDLATLFYQGEMKEYILSDVLYQKKDGKIILPKVTESHLILTTCNKNYDDIQDIYIFTEKK